MITADIILGMLNLLVGFAETAIAVRILLKLMGASVTAPFVRWVYDMSSPLISPFIGMFPSPTLTGPFTIEFSAIFALFVYMFIGYLLQEAIWYLNNRIFNRKAVVVKRGRRVYTEEDDE
ncbi:MAG: YggT family protein [Patescibacteria group bacterium]